MASATVLKLRPVMRRLSSKVIRWLTRLQFRRHFLASRADCSNSQPIVSVRQFSQNLSRRRRGPIFGIDYDFRTGKHEVTNAQYAEFLNGVDTTGANALGLYKSSMTTF